MKKATRHFAIPAGNRGKPLEELVDRASEVYDALGLAMVFSVPPEAVIARTAGGQVRSAYYKKRGGLDRVAIIKDKVPIAFDAKSTRETTRFPLDNLELHQAEWAYKFARHGGWSGLLVEFDDDTSCPPRYMVPIDLVWQAINANKRSIPRAWIEADGILIKPWREQMIELDWLGALWPR